MSRRSVGRSVDSLFWRAGVIRLFPSPFPLTRPAQHPREKQVSLCQLAAPWQPWAAPVGLNGSAGAIPMRASSIRDRHGRGCTIARRSLRYVPRYLPQYLRRGSGIPKYIGRYLCKQPTIYCHCRSLPRYCVGGGPNSRVQKPLASRALDYIGMFWRAVVARQARASHQVDGQLLATVNRLAFKKATS